MAEDHYKALGVSRDATDAQIKRAYKKLARKHHPDVDNNGNIERFHEIQRAYEVLGDPNSRRQYDRKQSRQIAPASYPFGRGPGFGAVYLRSRDLYPSIESLVADLGRFFSEGFPNTPGNGQDNREVEILLSSREAAVGGVLPLQVPVMTPCYVCRGEGECFPFACRVCRGEGCLPAQRTVELDIPPGIADGSVINLCLDDPVGGRPCQLLARIRVLAP